MLRTIIIIVMINFLLIPSLVNAIEVAPRISDREIIEGLADIREDIKEIRADIRRLEDGQRNIEKRFDDVNKRFDDVNKRFDILQWMFGIFITVTIVILGFVLRMQWQLQKRQTVIETTLETQKDELAFIKGLIEKFIHPKGAL